jgi:hypothetical protein
MPNREETFTDLGGYFQILISIMMSATFVALALILLNAYYGKDEKETEKD